MINGKKIFEALWLHRTNKLKDFCSLYQRVSHVITGIDLVKVLGVCLCQSCLHCTVTFHTTAPAMREAHGTPENGTVTKGSFSHTTISCLNINERSKDPTPFTSWLINLWKLRVDYIWLMVNPLSTPHEGTFHRLKVVHFISMPLTKERSHRWHGILHTKSWFVRY